MVIVQVSHPDTLDLPDQSVCEGLAQHLQLLLSADIEGETVPVAGNEELGRAHVTAPRGQGDVFREGHELDLGTGSQDVLSAELQSFLAEVPVQGIGGEVVFVDRLYPFHRRGEIPGRVGDEWSTGRDEQVRLPGGQFLKAGDPLSEPSAVAVVAADPGLRDGILETVEVEDPPSFPDQIAGEGDAFPSDLGEVGDRVPRIAGGLHHGKFQSLPLHHLVLLHEPVHGQRSHRDFVDLLLVVIEALLPELLPEGLGLRES